MHRFFIPSGDISKEEVIISDAKQAHHIRDVLRLKAKDSVVIFDENANEYKCQIAKLIPELSLKIKTRVLSSGVKNKFSLTVACAIPKNSNMDDIIDKLTQIGVDRIIPLKTRRVIVRLDEKKAVLRLSRWKKIALSASQQSQRKSLAAIDAVKEIKDVLEESEDYDLKLIPTLAGERKTLKEVLANNSAKNILVLIGPEGDFTDEEVRLAIKYGCISVSLGSNVLRVETAAVSAASFIILYLSR